jgi:hypothetical protein
MGDPRCEAIKAQAHKIEEDCDRATYRDALVSANWYKWNLGLGISSAVFAATSAFLAGNDGKLFGGQVFVTAALALISAVLTSVLTFLSPSEKANAYHEYSNRYLSLRNRLRKFVAVDCLAASQSSELEEKYDKFLEQKDQIDSEHPVVPQWAYPLAEEREKEKKEKAEKEKAEKEKAEKEKAAS